VPGRREPGQRGHRTEPDRDPAIASGVRATARAAAAGMISIAVISSTPTTLIATATSSASASVSTSRSRRGSTPAAAARSAFSVERSSRVPAPGDQRRDRERPAVDHDEIAASTARMSPKR
jgi:hypothetical protein